MPKPSDAYSILREAEDAASAAAKPGRLDALSLPDLLDLRTRIGRRIDSLRRQAGVIPADRVAP